MGTLAQALVTPRPRGFARLWVKGSSGTFDIEVPSLDLYDSLVAAQADDNRLTITIKLPEEELADLVAAARRIARSITRGAR